MKKIAIIDLDVKACKLLIAQYTDTALLNYIDELVEPLKLWADIDNDNVIKPARVVETISVLRNFKKHLDLLGVDTVTAYCSNSFKNVKNYRGFIEEINNETGFKFDVLSDEKLIRAVHLVNANTIEQIKAIVVNIQDDYINIVKYNRRNVIDSCKFNFGALTLAKMFENETSLSSSEKMDKMVEFAKSQFSKFEAFTAEDEEYKRIGMGGAFVNAGRLTRMGTKYSVNLDHNYELTIDNFQKSYQVVRNLSVDKTKKIKGVSAERADLVASGFAIIKALMDCYFVNSFNINDLGVANGILYDQMNTVFGDRPIGDILTQSLEACNVFYDKPENNNKQIFAFANDLFEELRVLHRYTKQQQKILKIASYLATCGRRINAKNYEKNSFHIVLNSEIYGATHREILLASFVCASQNLEDFDFSNWVRFKDIVSETDLEIVKKLAVLVKIAKLIDKSKTCDHLVCDVLGDKCILNVVPKTNCQCVLEDVRKASNDFRLAFNKQLQVL